MCNEAVQSKPEVLEHVPDRFKTQEMCEYPWQLKHVPDRFKTPEMWNRAVQEDPWILKLVEHTQLLSMHHG